MTAPPPKKGEGGSGKKRPASGKGKAKAGSSAAGRSKAGAKGKGKPPKGGAGSAGKRSGGAAQPPKRKGPAKQPKQKPKQKQKPADRTQEYELGDDFLEDLEGKPVLDARAAGPPREDEGSDAEPGDDERDPERDEQSELEKIIDAETQEWDGIEAVEGGEDGEDEGDREDDPEKTLVASAAAAGDKARSKITSGFEAVKDTRGFEAVKRFRPRFPLWARFLTAALVIVLSVGTATAASLLMYLDGIAAELEPGEEFAGIDDRLQQVDGGAPQTIMILGSDKRPEFKKDTFRGLSDTTMLLRVDPDRNALALWSLPRDLAVDIPGHGRTKLNEAYAYGGPELTLQTIQRLTDVPASPGGMDIHHVVNVDFEGFARAVNAIDCVYVDVDRRYFNSNEGKPAELTYDEIDIQPGYQALCGFDALDYARYRHTDNDVVRGARQQDFLREARQKVPPEVIFAERKELIEIFTEHTTSDINDADTMLQVLKLFLEARNAPVQEVHFEGELGPSFVTTTPQQIDTAVREFLGLEDTPGARGTTAQPEDPAAVTPQTPPDATGATPAAPAAAKARAKAQARARAKKEKAREEPSNLINTDFGRELAKPISLRVAKLPVYYPAVVEVGSEFAQKPRVYKVNGTGDGSPPDGQRLAYKWVLSRPELGEYYGFMATRWKDPPILRNPSETREVGGREYRLYYGGDRLRIVAWEDDRGSYWVTNTLIQSLTDREMIEIAKGMTELKRGG